MARESEGRRKALDDDKINENISQQEENCNFYDNVCGTLSVCMNKTFFSM
jgi:hypothetical protein